MILNICGEVNYEMFTSLTKAYTSLVKGDILYIYFSSPEGGSTDAAEAVIDIINTNKELTSLIFYGENYSSGMHIFLKTICSKRILRDTRGMYHFSWQEMIISEGGKPSSDYDKFSLKEMKNSLIKTIAYLKTTKLTEKEIKIISKSKEMYFTYDRMLELIS